MRWRIAKHKAGFTLIIYEGRNRRRVALKAANKWLAQAEASDLVADIERRKPREVKTVGQIIDDYIAQTEAITKQEMIYRSKPLKEALGGLTPDMITEAICKGFAAERKRSAGTLRVELGLMNTALKCAKKHKQIDDAPWVWMPAAPPPRDRVLTHDEYGKLIAAATSAPHVRLFCVLAANTAARSGAVLSLKWGNVSLDQRRIVLSRDLLRQKGRAATLPINDKLLPELVEAQKAAMTPFVIEYAGKPLKSIDRGFNAAVKRAGLGREVTPHVLRHTAASWMAMDRVPMQEIARVLGHRNSRITEEVYAKYHPDYLQEAVKSLG